MGKKNEIFDERRQKLSMEDSKTGFTMVCCVRACVYVCECVDAFIAAEVLHYSIISSYSVLAVCPPHR